jgi:hypothetical protein
VLRAEHRRHVVRVQARRVHHLPRQDLLAPCAQEHAVGDPVCTDERGARQEDRTGRLARTEQGTHVRLGVHDA